MAYKPCPKCDKSWGPRTKMCSCGHVFIKSSSSEDDDDFEPSIRSIKRNCANCGLEFESVSYKIDAYGNINHSFRFDHYCGSNCLEESSEKKDDLLEELLCREDLQSFFEAKSTDSDYKSIFDYISARKVKEKKLSEYLELHPKITFTTDPKKRILTVRDCEEVGIRVPPKIGDYEGAEPEAPVLSKLDRLLFRGEKVNLSEDNDEFENEVEEIEDSEIEGEDFGDLKEEVKPNPLAKMLGFQSSAPVQSAILPIKTISTTGVDMTSMPRQGQKKCGWVNKVYIGKGCGTIVGVRTSICKCGYKFPVKV